MQRTHSSARWFFQKKKISNQWEVHLIEFRLCKDTRTDPQFQKATAQHSILISNLHRQGYREVKLHVILVGVMRIAYKDHTDKPLADFHQDCQKIKKLSHKKLTRTFHQTFVYTHINKICTVKQLRQQQSWCGSGCRGTQPPWPTLIFFFRVCGGGLPGAGFYVTPSLNHAGCVITTFLFFVFSFSFCGPNK